MSGKARQSLAELVNAEAELGSTEGDSGCWEEEGEHDGPVGDLIAYCDNGGHALVGERLPGIHNWQKEKICVAHWRDLCELFVSCTDKLINCEDCGALRGFTLYVEWPGGFTSDFSIHHYPHLVTKNRKAAR